MSSARDGDTVTINVSPMWSDGTLGTTMSASGTGTLGDLEFPSTVPVSIGGKLNPNGTIALSASDQFNGLIDNAVLVVG